MTGAIHYINNFELYQEKGQNFPSVMAIIHCKKYRYTANVYRDLWGSHRFYLQYLWERAVRITEKSYTPQRERLRMLWGNPVIFTDCGENGSRGKNL